MSILSNRLKEAREEKRLTQLDVYKLTNINNKSLSGYENDVATPDPETLRKLADLYDVSTDYLLGRTETRKWETETLSFNTVDIDGLSDEDIAAVKRIIEGLKEKHLGKKK